MSTRSHISNTFLWTSQLPSLLGVRGVRNSDSSVAVYMHSRCYLLTLTPWPCTRISLVFVLSAQISRSHTSLASSTASANSLALYKHAFAIIILYPQRWNSDLNPSPWYASGFLSCGESHIYVWQLEMMNYSTAQGLLPLITFKRIKKWTLSNSQLSCLMDVPSGI